MSGVWIHKVARCGSPLEAINNAAAMNADRVIVKARDGCKEYNKEHLAELADRAAAAELPLWIWSWNYSTDSNGDTGYCTTQGELLAADAERLGAAGVVLNLEAPFSSSKFHRWGSIHEAAYGNKEARAKAIRENARALILAVRENTCEHIRLGISTFPVPSQHALPSDLFATAADVIMPQVYFKGIGYSPKIKKSILQWTKLGAAELRFSGPGWRGSAKMKSMAGSLRTHQPTTAPIDWWVLDRMSESEIECARNLANQERNLCC